MDITDVLSADCVAFDQDLVDKGQVFDFLTGLLVRCGVVRLSLIHISEPTRH